MKFRKKANDIEAVKYEPGMEDCWLVLDKDGYTTKVCATREEARQTLTDYSMPGGHISAGVGYNRPGGEKQVELGHWLVRGDDGRITPVTEQFLFKFYEPVEA